MECSICFSEFNGSTHRPLCLSCGHTLCYACTEDLLAGGASFACPACGKVVEIPSLQDVPVNFALLSLLDKQPEVPKLEGLPCKLHSKKAKFFCVNCSYFFCTYCFESHKTHQIDSLEAHLNKKIDKLLIKVIQEKTSLDSALAGVAGVINSVEEDWKLAKRQLEARYAEVGSSSNEEFNERNLQLEAVRLENSKTTADRLNAFNVRCEVLNRSQGNLRQFRQAGCTPADLETISEIEAQLKDTVITAVALRMKRVRFRVTESLGELTESTLEFGAPSNDPQPKVQRKSLLSKVQRPKPMVVAKEEVKEPLAHAKRKSIKKKTAYWWHEGRSGALEPFNSSDNQAIEKAYQSEQPVIRIRGATINFERMIMCKDTSNEGRRIAREVS